MAESSEQPPPGRKAAADAAELERCLEVLARSQSPEARGMAARHRAREARRKAAPPEARRKEQLGQEAVDALLARSTDPRRRPLRRLSLWREGTLAEAAHTFAVLSFQAYLDREDELVRMYHEKGYVEVELYDDAD